LRDLAEDERGIEGLPLKLLILAIVMGISVPSILAMWSNVERVQIENRLESEMDYLIIRIQQVHRSGLGNAMSVEVNLKSGLMTSIEYVRVGDNLSSQTRSTIRWKLSGEAENTLLIEDQIPVCGRNTDAFELNEGHSSLYLEVKKKESGLVYVEISSQD